jgi:predicted nucleic acid-binding protein
VSVILDTVVWSQFLRAGRAALDPVAAEVGRLIQSDAVVMLGAIRQELLSGVQASRYEQLREHLRFYPNLPLTEEDDERAAEYYDALRAGGVQGTGTDLLICAAASLRGLRIFTLDRDFEFYERHLPIKLHRFRGK